MKNVLWSLTCWIDSTNSSWYPLKLFYKSLIRLCINLSLTLKQSFPTLNDVLILKDTFYSYLKCLKAFFSIPKPFKHHHQTKHQKIFILKDKDNGSSSFQFFLLVFHLNFFIFFIFLSFLSRNFIFYLRYFTYKN